MWRSPQLDTFRPSLLYPNKTALSFTLYYSIDYPTIYPDDCGGSLSLYTYFLLESDLSAHFAKFLHNSVLYEKMFDYQHKTFLRIHFRNSHNIDKSVSLINCRILGFLHILLISFPLLSFGNFLQV